MDIGDYYRAILPYYDASLEGRGDLPFWESIVRRWSARRVLELGCGTGRVTDVLSRHVPVIAADLLVEMLHRARQRAPRARFVAADLRTFAFSKPFDLIVLADDPLAHVVSREERRQIMQRIADHLSPRGRLVLEGLVRAPRTPLHVPRREVGRFTVEEWWTPADDDATWSATYRYVDGPTIVEASALLRSWTPSEVDRLPEAGLEIESVWGDFEGGRFDGRSQRIVIVAAKATAV